MPRPRARRSPPDSRQGADPPDGIFAIATGFTTSTQLSRDFQTLLDGMTSPHLRDFLYGNLLGTVVTSVMVEGAEPKESPVSA